MDMPGRDWPAVQAISRRPPAGAAVARSALRLGPTGDQKGLQLLLGDADLLAEAMDAELLLRDAAAQGFDGDCEAGGGLRQSEQRCCGGSTMRS
jgi:hypothetical protein